MPQKFWKYKNEIIFYTQLLILIFLLIVINLAMVGWDIRQVRWQVYGATTGFSLYSKMIATNYSFNRELLPKLVEKTINDKKETEETNEIIIYENSIKAIHKDLLNQNKTGVFKEALMIRNFKYRLENERLYIDIKGEKNYNFRVKNIEKRKAVHELLVALETKQYTKFYELLDREDIRQHVNIRKMSRLAMKRSNVKMTHLFVTKTSNIDDDLDGGASSLLFNKWIYSFKTQCVFLIGMPILSLLWSGFYYEEYIINKYVWLDIAGYLISITMGLFSGLSIGTESAQKGYVGKLKKRTEVIQEVMNIVKYLEQEKGA